MNLHFGTYEFGIFISSWWAFVALIGLFLLLFALGLHVGYRSGYEHGRKPFARIRDAKGHFVGRGE